MKPHNCGCGNQAQVHSPRGERSSPMKVLYHYDPRSLRGWINAVIGADSVQIVAFANAHICCLHLLGAGVLDRVTNV